MCAKNQWSKVEEIFETPHDNPVQWAIMLTAYFDESFEGGDGWVVVAGFLGNKKAWDELQTKWPIALKKKKTLHMKNLNWKYPGRHAGLLERLGSVPHECGLQPVFAAVRMSDYEVDNKVPKKIRHGYFVTAVAPILAIMNHIPKRERVKLVWESQVAYAEVRERAISYIAKMPQHRGRRGRKQIAGSESIPKSLSLEPSDYLAYAILQSLIDKNSERARLCSPLLKSGKRRIGGKLKENVVGKFVPLMKKRRDAI